VNRNEASIERFLEEQKVNDLKPGTLETYHRSLSRLKIFLGEKAFEDATREDLIRFFAEAQGNLARSTIHMYKARTKRFYAWLFQSEAGEYPSVVRWIRSTNPRGSKDKGEVTGIRPEDLLTDEEILRLVDAADHPRDQAIIMLLYETACEAQEILNMKVKSIVTEKARTKVTLSMGASARSLMIRDSVPYLQAWLNIHPLRGNPEAGLWITRQQGLRPIGYDNLNRLLRDAGKRAGITKPLSPRWLRHAGLTRMAKVLKNEQLLKKFAGWTPDSKMAAIYIHLSGRDLDEEIARLHGEAPAVEEKPLKGPLNPQVCPRCGGKVAATHAYCPGCGQRLVLGLEETRELERDLFLDTYHEILMEQREKTRAMSPDFYKIMDMVEERIRARKVEKNQDSYRPKK